MTKRIMAIFFVTLLLFGIFWISGCNNESLDDYQKKGKEAIDVYVSNIDQSNYSTEEWDNILSIATYGKQSIESATNKTEVDMEIQKTEEAIDLGYYEVEINDMIELHTWHFTSGVPNNAIVVKYADHNAIIECVVDNGQFGFSADAPKSLTVEPEEVFYWQPNEKVEKAFVNIRIKIDENIVGYAIVKIEQKSQSVEYTASVLRSAVFPKINGNFQNITTLQVDNIINEITEEN